jgi:hypothetical protein
VDAHVGIASSRLRALLRAVGCARMGETVESPQSVPEHVTGACCGYGSLDDLRDDLLIILAASDIPCSSMAEF